MESNILRLEEQSKEIIQDIHVFKERFIDKIEFACFENETEVPIFPVMLSNCYSENEPEYNTSDLIWKNPKYKMD
ncbi:hypothetical protein [Leptospira harrisiae]|uniref:hypothetical protein n=1 Tax=Leptospira harrisiae TaxID=2023189 RepID=UPI000C2A2BEE|nr:hypothetical protein [Leptospira harrisiae]PKA09303.1 hypothetical protein CH366_06235 [Leptospira harrisiae]